MKSNQLLGPTLIIAFLVFIGVLFCIKPIPQDLSYHLFADDHTYFHVPNFWNVMSNFLFLVFGSLFFTLIAQTKSIFNQFLIIVIGLGFVLTGLGSAYYHWDPNNETLVWDRIPMTLVFVSFFLLLIGENISVRLAKMTFIPALVTGVMSVVYWISTERSGAGDLRPYVFIQFYPLLGTLVILFFERKRIVGGEMLLLAFLCYVVAKIFEMKLDQIGLELTGFSGHSVKHIAASFSALFLYRWIKKLVHTTT